MEGKQYQQPPGQSSTPDESQQAPETSLDSSAGPPLLPFGIPRLPPDVSPEVVEAELRAAYEPAMALQRSNRTLEPSTGPSPTRDPAIMEIDYLAARESGNANQVAMVSFPIPVQILADYLVHSNLKREISLFGHMAHVMAFLSHSWMTASLGQQGPSGAPTDTTGQIDSMLNTIFDIQPPTALSTVQRCTPPPTPAEELDPMLAKPACDPADLEEVTLTGIGVTSEIATVCDEARQHPSGIGATADAAIRFGRALATAWTPDDDLRTLPSVRSRPLGIPENQASGNRDIIEGSPHHSDGPTGSALVTPSTGNPRSLRSQYRRNAISHPAYERSSRMDAPAGRTLRGYYVGSTAGLRGTIGTNQTSGKGIPVLPGLRPAIGE